MKLIDKALQKKAGSIRAEVINVSMRNSAGHIASSLSCVDILVVLYYRAMVYRASDTLWENRDRLIFSKAHGCYVLYAILADLKILPTGHWKNFYTKESSLLGCMERRPEYGLEAGCGSLGHGLPIAVGLAFGAKLQKKKYHIFCISGDGEFQEGSTWEALQFAVKHNISNLTVIIDENQLQAMDFITNVLDVEIKDIVKKLKGFGLSPIMCDGHDVIKLVEALRSTKMSTKKVPSVIIAKTTKGYGLNCMENVPKFHFRIPACQKLLRGKK